MSLAFRACPSFHTLPSVVLVLLILLTSYTHSKLLQVVNDELSTWGLDHPSSVGGGVVWLSLSEGNSLSHFGRCFDLKVEEDRW
jgi:hypothetical protein